MRKLGRRVAKPTRSTSRIYSVTASFFDPRPRFMSEFSDQNVFEICAANGGPGFWVRRTTWGATIARIVGVGRFTKPAPYFGSPPVVMDVYGLSGELKDELTKMPSPGTYKTWRLIEAPDWAATAKLRKLDDPAIAEALRRLDRRR